MARDENVWIVVSTHPVQGTNYLVFRSFDKAREAAADIAAALAQEIIEQLAWQDSPPEALTDTVDLFKKKDYSGALIAWEDARSDSGPFEEDVVLEGGHLVE